jgi:hypothetical protein
VAEDLLEKEEVTGKEVLELLGIHRAPEPVEEPISVPIPVAPAAPRTGVGPAELGRGAAPV